MEAGKTMRKDGYFCGDLFPTPVSLIVFAAYLGLFVNQGILVTASKNADNTYSYSTTTVVMLTEVLKLLVSGFIYINNHSFKKLCIEVCKNYKVLLLYFVPALLYCFYNNLAFVNLAAFDPTTYYLLLQLRVVVTGIIFQILFKKQLSRKQWLSLLLLTIGCIVKQLGLSSQAQAPKNGDTAASSHETVFSSFLNFNLIFILIQVLCSCFAGVYNEYLLKDVGAEVHIMIQNVFMYLDSIVCNLFVLTFTGEVVRVFTSEAVHSVAQPTVLAVMANSAACGIVTSLFLKKLNSILKTFASALEPAFTAILCFLIFAIPIDAYTMLSIAIVSYATYMYSQNPVVNVRPPVTTDHNQSGDKEPLVKNGVDAV